MKRRHRTIHLFVLFSMAHAASALTVGQVRRHCIENISSIAVVSIESTQKFDQNIDQRIRIVEPLMGSFKVGDSTMVFVSAADLKQESRVFRARESAPNDLFIVCFSSSMSNAPGHWTTALIRDISHEYGQDPDYVDIRNVVAFAHGEKLSMRTRSLMPKGAALKIARDSILSAQKRPIRNLRLRVEHAKLDGDEWEFWLNYSLDQNPKLVLALPLYIAVDAETGEINEVSSSGD